MNVEDKESIMKDLLYEKAARVHLENLKPPMSNKFGWVSAAAAILILTFGAIFFFQNNNTSNNTAIADAHYVFPTITKSRSAEKNIVDDYIPELAKKNYAEVLAALEGKQLSQRDEFVMVHLLYSLQKFDASSELINNGNWTDEYFRDEVLWIDFLISFRQAESDDQIESKLSKLSPKYTVKAKKILERVVK